MKKSKLKVDNTQYNVNYSILYTFGEIKINVIYATCIFRNKEGKLGIEIHDCWEESAEYMGIKITKYQDLKKFKDFHKEMGIYISAMIDEHEQDEESVLKEIQKQIPNLDKFIK